jgi:hypothetical protein
MIFLRRPSSFFNIQPPGRPELPSGCNNCCRAVNNARWHLLQQRFQTAGRALPTSKPGSSKGKTPLLRRQAGVASSWSVEKTPLVRLLAVARRCGNAKSRLPRSREELLVQVSLCGRSEIADHKERSILKIVPPFSFEFSSFSGRQELALTLKGSARSSNAPSTTILLYVKTFKFNL